jgi:hypothetical protein
LSKATLHDSKEFFFLGGGPQSSSGIFCMPYADINVPGLRHLQNIPLGHAFQHLERSANSQEAQEPLLRPEEEGQETKEETLDRLVNLVESLGTDWPANAYDLLKRNCNSFTDALAFQLTGNHAPAWLNRAAWVGQNLPCLVPQDFETPSGDLTIEVPSATNGQPSALHIPTLDSAAGGYTVPAAA